MAFLAFAFAFAFAAFLRAFCSCRMQSTLRARAHTRMARVGQVVAWSGGVCTQAAHWVGHLRAEDMNLIELLMAEAQSV